MNWKRVACWVPLIFVAAVFVGQLLGPGLSTAGIFASSAVLYFLYMKPIHVRRIAHFVVAFLLVEVVDQCVALVLGAPMAYLLESWRSSALHLCAALVGFAASWLAARQGRRTRKTGSPFRRQGQAGRK